MLITAGDFTGVSKTSACNIVTQVTDAIARLRPIYVRFPETQAEILSTKQTFYGIARFPYVVGAIDCTHVRIQSPGGNEAERYRNRKGYFSWNVQAVCDARLRFTDIVARWPGSSHDQTIFNNRDGGYGNSNFLLTPLRQPSTAAESLYNESHIRSRNCIERAFGVWKRRFPVLSLGMRLSQERSQAVIVATTVLHNLAIEERDGDPPSEVDDNNALEENVHSIQQSFF
uniref:DDE Tnp4 domain-containing protein n=1 Tax=Dendroctonus ponderosae TaxID=77166 RepID=A0AAR5PJ70_DENPD